MRIILIIALLSVSLCTVLSYLYRDSYQDFCRSFYRETSQTFQSTRKTDGIWEHHKEPSDEIWEQQDTLPEVDSQLFEDYLRALEALKEMGISSSDHPEYPEAITDEQIIERYIHESEKLKEVSMPIFNYLKDHAWIRENYMESMDLDKWYCEYDQPLFEAAKLAMTRVTGIEDYLGMWENRISELIVNDVIVALLVSSEFRGKYEGFTLFSNSGM